MKTGMLTLDGGGGSWTSRTNPAARATRTTSRASCRLRRRTTNRPCPRSGAAASARTGCGTFFRSSTGLGSSWTSQRYSVKSVAEAEAYLAHPVLGPRLVECAEAALRVDGLSANEIFGSPDDMKLRSCATLFASVSPEGSVFHQVDRQVLSRPARRQDAEIDARLATVTRVSHRNPCHSARRSPRTRSSSRTIRKSSTWAAGTGHDHGSLEACVTSSRCACWPVWDFAFLIRSSIG